MTPSTRVLTASGTLLGLGVATQVAPRALRAPAVQRVLPRLAGLGDAEHVALTFDDGPDPATTPRFLDRLAQLRATATFFCLGEMVRRAGSLPREMAAAGHELAVHGFDHGAQITRSPRQWLDGLVRTRALIEDQTGIACRFYRPPHGKLNGAVLWAAASAGLQPVLWGAQGSDWTAVCTPESVLSELRRAIRPGVTILLHDTDAHAAPGSWRATLGALEPLLALLRDERLGVGPLRDHGL